MNMTEVTVAHAKNLMMGQGSYIDDDLVLFDRFEDVPLKSEPRRMQCLFVALCLGGTAQYTVDTKEHLVKANDVIIVNEGQVLGEYMLSRDCRGVAFMGSIPFYHEVIKDIHEMSALFLFASSHPVFSLNPQKAKTVVEYFNLIKQRVDDPTHHFRKELAATLLKSLIYEVGNEIWQHQQTIQPGRTRAESIFAQFINLVKENFRERRRVSWYSEQLCITSKYLSETVKLVSKRTPNEWIDNYVTLEIRVLLKNSTMSIKQIAQELHFPNQSFLGRYFKEHVGVSPTEYRRG